MRILFINTLETGGGAARVARWLAEELIKRGHEVALLVSQKSSAAEWVIELPSLTHGNVVEKIGQSVLARTLGISPGSPQARHYWRRGLQQLNPVSRLNQLLGREDFSLPGCGDILRRLPFDPEVIHLHNLHCFNGLTHFDLRVLPELTRGRATVATLHETWMLTGHCAHPFTCERWRVGCGDCPDLAMYPRIARDGTAANFHRKQEIFQQMKLHVAGPGHWIMEMARQSPLGHCFQGTHVISHGVDCDFFRPAVDRAAARAKIGVRPEERVFSYVADTGKASPYRDYVFIERLMQDWTATDGSVPIVLFEVGGAVSARSDGKVRTVGLGPLRAEGVRDVLQASDALLHPARGDTYPTVVMEAMACGTPAMATRVCAIPEQVTNGVDGVLHDLGDLPTALAGLRQFCVRDARAEAMRAAARHRAEVQFQEQPLVDGYENLYRQLLIST